ncbi:MAG: zinc ribbon domain-containing protein [Bacteroidales bacterium]|nr:zinc ribbon domain-containing protein [Bacteroidales bacterium]
MESQLKQKELYKESILNQVNEIRASSDGVGCPYCGQPVKKSWEWCPSCGHSLVDWCTFCGADIPRGEDECPECGMSRSGIVCPKCGTRNASGFCRKCNEPLTLAAKKEQERALKDPQFVKAAELAVQAAELLARIEAEEQEVPESEIKEIELPEDVLRLKELLGKTTLRQAQGLRTSTTGEPCRTTCSAANKMKSKAELRAEYSKIQEELNKALEGMLPPVGSTPQEQRNYFSARKLPVEKVILTKGREAWVCNFCGCWHNCPSECCEPWHGGKWVYEYKEEKILDFK